jgi:hypothetical protein
MTQLEDLFAHFLSILKMTATREFHQWNIESLKRAFDWAKVLEEACSDDISREMLLGKLTSFSTASETFDTTSGDNGTKHAM